MDSVGSGTCPKEYTYPSGEQVELKAVPAPGYRFVNWSGSVEGSDEIIQLEMSCTKTVHAVFAPLGNPLSIRATPDIGGEVTVAPQQNPGQGYDTGTRVSLSARAVEGYRFSHWSGDLQGEENPVTVVMDAAKGINAHFVRGLSLCLVVGSLWSGYRGHRPADVLPGSQADRQDTEARESTEVTEAMTASATHVGACRPTGSITVDTWAR